MTVLIIATFCLGILGAYALVLFFIKVLLEWIDKKYADRIPYGRGVVRDKNKYPAYTTTTWIMSGSMMIPLTNYHSPSYELVIENNGSDFCADVSRSFYDKIEIGHEFDVYAIVGKFGFYGRTIFN